MPITTVDDALAFWFSRINYEHRGMPSDPRALRLDRMRALLSRLGHPERRLRIVHIAGSKGKGSTAAMLASIVQAAGYRVGLFTSPHLTDARERVQVDGRPIPAACMVASMQRIADAVDRVTADQGSSPTFFEIATALGFLHFAQSEVDLAVIEVGLGGRFDSTNVCDPAVTAIVSISRDHTQQLGDIPAQIAFEKAGIIKPGRPVISGVREPAARAVIQRIARQRHAPLTEIDADFHFEYEPGHVTPSEWLQPKVSCFLGSSVARSMRLGLWGSHQAANAAVAFACVARLRDLGMTIPESAIRTGLAGVRWPARIELVGRHPDVVLDCAHNEASIACLLETLDASFPKTRRGLVLGISRDKDLPAIVTRLRGQFDHVVFTRYAGSRRAADPQELAELWCRLGGGSWETATPAEAAVERIRERIGPRGLICITGSVFLAGELRPILLHQAEAAAAPVCTGQNAV